MKNLMNKFLKSIKKDKKALLIIFTLSTIVAIPLTIILFNELNLGEGQTAQEIISTELSNISLEVKITIAVTILIILIFAKFYKLGFVYLSKILALTILIESIILITLIKLVKNAVSNNGGTIFQMFVIITLTLFYLLVISFVLNKLSKENQKIKE